MEKLKFGKNASDLLFLLPLSAFFLLYALNRGSLASWDEALYAAVSKEIVLSGQWLRFTIAGELWVDKPPLSLWATALSFKLFGINEFGARFFSAICGVGTVLLTYVLGRHLLGRWAGLMGALVLLSSSHYFRFSRFGMMDAPLAFFFTLALLLFWLGRDKSYCLVLSGVAIGLGILTKSLAAVLVIPITWLYCWLADEPEIFRRRSYWAGLALAALIAAPWNIYQLVAFPNEYVSGVFLKNFIQRATSAIEGHSGNAYFYIRTLINKYHPWILIAIVSGPYFLYRAIREREKEILFLTIWMFFVLAVITLVQTKLPWYLMPLYPPLSLSVGYALSKMIRDTNLNEIWVRVAFVATMALHVPYSHIFEQDYARDIKGIAPAALALAPAQSPVYLYNYHEAPAVAFYFGRRGVYVDDEASFRAAARKEKNFYCLIHERHLKEIEPSLASLGLSRKASFDDLILLAK